jgi:hypothetical protein
MRQRHRAEDITFVETQPMKARTGKVRELAVSIRLPHSRDHVHEVHVALPVDHDAGARVRGERRRDRAKECDQPQ